MFMRNLMMASQIEAKALRYEKAMRLYVDHGMIADLRRQLLKAEMNDAVKGDIIMPKKCKSILKTAKKTTGRRAAAIKAETEAKKDDPTDQTPVPKSPDTIIRESALFSTIRMAMEDVVYTTSDEMWARVVRYLEYYSTKESDQKILHTIATLLARGNALDTINP